VQAQEKVQLGAGSLLQSWAAAPFGFLRQRRTVNAEQLASCSRYRHATSNKAQKLASQEGGKFDVPRRI